MMITQGDLCHDVSYLVVLPVQSQTLVSRPPGALHHVAPVRTSGTSALSWPSLIVAVVIRSVEVLLWGRLSVGGTRCVWWLDGSGSPVLHISILEVGRIARGDAAVLR